MFQANMFNPALLGGRGAGGGRRGHGLSRSLRVSETMLSILTLSVTPACLRLSVRARFTQAGVTDRDRKSTRLNSSHLVISYAVFCLKKKKYEQLQPAARADVAHWQ